MAVLFTIDSNKGEEGGPCRLIFSAVELSHSMRSNPEYNGLACPSEYIVDRAFCFSAIVSVPRHRHCRRRRMAVVRMTRAREFDAWLKKCTWQRYIIHGLVNAVIITTTLTLAYTNLVFAARFDK